MRILVIEDDPGVASFIIGGIPNDLNIFILLGKKDQSFSRQQLRADDKKFELSLQRFIHASVLFISIKVIRAA